MPKPPPICCLGLLSFFMLLSIRGFVQPEQQYKISSVIDQPGLASSEIYSVGQDADGFIWIGTNIGISRFDGYTFKNYSTIDTVRIQRVSAINKARNGRLYFGGYGGLFYVEQGKIFNIPLPFKQSDILCIHMPQEGGLWIGGNNLPPTYLSPGVLSRSSSAEIKPFFSQQTWNSMAGNQSVYSLETDSEGNLYIGTLNKMLKYNGEELEILWSDETQNYYLRSIIAKTPDSIYWGGMKTSLRFMQPQGYDVLVDYFLVNSINTSKGIYALLNNIYRQTKNGFQLEVDLDQFRDSWYQSFIQDQEGSFWIGAHNDLLKISPTPFKVYSAATHPNMDQLYSVNETSDGNILLGGHRGRIHLFQEESFSRLLPNDQRVVPRAEVLAMHLTKQDDLWFGSAYEGISLLRNDQLHRFTKADGLGDNACYFFHEGQNGELWLGGDYAITRMRKNADQSLQFDHFPAAGFDNLAPRFYTATTDAWGNLWAGSSVGLFLLNEGQLELWPFPKPLASNPIITHIVQDKKGDVWISTQGDGLWQGRFVASQKLEIIKRWSKQDGLHQDRWLGLHVDQQDRIWVANSNEICCLNSIDSTQLFCYNRNDGWPEFSPRFIQFHESQDSILWIVGQSVLIRFSPYQLHLNRLAPKAFIEKVELMGTEATIFDYVKNKERSFLLPKDLRLPYHRNFLRFYFTTTSQINPQKNRFKYRLLGTDAGWQHVGEMETRSVAYPNLSPGYYTFELLAANNHGIWSDVPASFSFTIRPPFWKTTLAYLCYTCLLFGLLWTARRQIIRRETLKSQLRVEQLEKEKAQELDQVRSRFFANISHEFRTPLTLIKAPLEDLLTSRKSDEERVLFLGMHQNTERLLQLVNQLLDLSKLEAGVLQIQTEPLDIYLLLKQLAGNFQSLASQKQLDFQIEIPAEPLPLQVDKDKFEKIILNLLSNAIKFAPIQGWVCFKATFNAYLKISIGNNGKSIPESDLEQIFDRFYQAADTRHQGAGIGLALVQEFVALHGGKVGAKSSPEATWFWVELPLERATSSIKMEKPEKVDHLYGIGLNDTTPVKKASAIADLIAEKPTLLLVEDHAEVRAYIQEKLSRHFKVIGVENGQKGWQQATQLLPDLIISDVMMPVMDGVNLCNKIKSDHRTDHIPIILLTAKADTESRISGLKTGADDYVAKPFNSEELIIRSQNLIEQRRKLQLRFSQNLRQTLASEPPNSAEKKFLKKAIALVETHMDNTDFSTSQFAKEMLLSRTQLHRKLKNLTDMSATDFVRNIRLEKAAQLIQQQSGTISEIAYEVGFNNLSYFAKCFKKKYGKAPSNY